MFPAETYPTRIIPGPITLGLFHLSGWSSVRPDQGNCSEATQIPSGQDRTWLPKDLLPPRPLGTASAVTWNLISPPNKLLCCQDPLPPPMSGVKQSWAAGGCF